MKTKLIAIVFLAFIGIAAAGYAIHKTQAVTAEYESFIAAAEENAAKEIPYIAVMRYRSAFAIRCEDESKYQDYLTQCELLGEGFYENAVKQYPTRFPESSAAYEALCKWYYDTENYSKFLATVVQARNLGLATERIRDYYYDIAYRYKYVMTGYDEAYTFLGNTALVNLGGLYGYLTGTGTYAIAPLFEEASQLVDGAAAVNGGSGWYMINGSGYKVAIPDRKVDSLSYVSNGLIRVSVDGKYGYTGPSMVVPDSLPFDYASNFKNGIAAVCEDDKWALVNPNGEKLTEFIFDDIVIDEYETCVCNNRIFVKENGSYHMIDGNFKPVGDLTFDEVYPFQSQNPAAVRVGNEWGFVSADGEMIVAPAYEEAKSYSSNGLAAVKIDGNWCYINPYGEVMVEGDFEECKPFSDNGIAAVKELGVWNYIELYLNYYA